MDSYLSALCIFYIECFNILMMTGGGGRENQYLDCVLGLCFFVFSTLPIDGSSVPKHVGVGTRHYSHFMICIFLYFVMCIC